MKSFNDSIYIGSATLKLLAELDAKIYRGFGYLQSRLHLYKFARLLSFTGDGYLYLAIAIVACLLFPPAGTYLLMTGLLGGLIEIPVYLTLKKYFKRNRPYVGQELSERVHTPSDEFSFPSGHATAGFLMAYLSSYFFPETAQFMYVWASLVALSRVLLRVHFVSDIIAGMLLGTGIAALTLWIFGFFVELPIA